MHIGNKRFEMNSLFHKLSTPRLKAAEVFARRHRLRFCGRGLGQLRWAEAELRAAGSPPSGTRPGGWVLVQTIAAPCEERYEGSAASCCCVEPALGFCRESYLCFMYNVFLECYLSVELLVTLIFRETRGVLFCFLSIGKEELI